MHNSPSTSRSHNKKLEDVGLPPAVDSQSFFSKDVTTPPLTATDFTTAVSQVHSQTSSTTTSSSPSLNPTPTQGRKAKSPQSPPSTRNAQSNRSSVQSPSMQRNIPQSPSQSRSQQSYKAELIDILPIYYMFSLQTNRLLQPHVLITRNWMT
jgi:hypothetical protein